jgi:hypothetical protein
VNTESPESDWNLMPEQSKVVLMTEQIGEKGGQVRDGCRMVEENATGGVAVAREFLVPHRGSPMELGCGSWGDEIADQQERVISSDTKEELPKGCAIAQFAGGQSETSRSGLPSSEYCSASLEDAERSCGSDRLGNSSMGKQVLGSFSPQVSCQSCGLAVGCEPENVECAEPFIGFGGKIL